MNICKTITHISNKFLGSNQALHPKGDHSLDESGGSINNEKYGFFHWVIKRARIEMVEYV
jgi:hypothetical protein